MNKVDVTEMIIEAKKAKGMSWEALAESIGLSPAFATSACLGMNSLAQDKAAKLVKTLELPKEAIDVLMEYPTKIYSQVVPTDPCVYRFYEIMGVYGDTMKALIQEKAGDGIMSAIDFELYVDKVPDPKGDRIEVKMSGKFLAYKAW